MSSMNRELGRKIRDTIGPFFHPLYFAYLLVDDRKSVNFFPSWIRSCFPGHTAVHDGIPWLPFQFTAWIDNYVTRDMNVFEFGSGGSTIYLAQRVKHLITVEHDRAWHAMLSKELEKRHVNNVQYLLREPEPRGPDSPVEYWDNYGNEYLNMDFRTYVTSIDEQPDHAFDLVLVDGRARKFCLEHAITKIRPNGYLLLDNSSTKEYLDFFHPLEGYPRFDITSIAPFWPPAKWQASGWRIPEGVR